MKHGTQLLYAAQKYRTDGLKAEEFWGKHHAQDAAMRLDEVTHNLPASTYHVFTTLQKED